MNNADTFPVVVDDERDWLVAHKETTGSTWSMLAKSLDTPTGTLSAFGTNNYNVRNEDIARRIFRYRQMLTSQAERSEGLAIDPGYFETPTSRRLTGLMVYAQMGRITLGATGPGTGKDMAAREYASSVSNVWIATMRESDRTLSAMCRRVLRAIGVDVRGGGSASHMSEQVVDKVRGKRGLLIVNEANHLGLAEIEEIRGWHDETGVGVCFLGNEELLMRIEGGAKSQQYGRLNSRIAQRHQQNLPEEADVVAFCDAWRLEDAGMRDLLRRIALTPGAGGLRECRQIVEGASMLAADDNRPLAFSDLKDAQSTRATRFVRTS